VTRFAILCTPLIVGLSDENATMERLAQSIINHQRSAFPVHSAEPWLKSIQQPRADSTLLPNSCERSSSPTPSFQTAASESHEHFEAHEAERSPINHSNGDDDDDDDVDTMADDDAVGSDYQQEHFDMVDEDNHASYHAESDDNGDIAEDVQSNRHDDGDSQVGEQILDDSENEMTMNARNSEIHTDDHTNDEYDYSRQRDLVANHGEN
jgi:hypothetical protein